VPIGGKIRLQLNDRRRLMGQSPPVPEQLGQGNRGSVGHGHVRFSPRFPGKLKHTPSAVPTAVFAWDHERVFPLKGKRGLGIMGRAFDLLPGGTMFSAPCILRGIVGVTVKMVSGTKAEIINFEPVIMAREDTDPKDLEEWHAELLEAFHTQPA
jgi:hypothetical protein